MSLLLSELVPHFGTDLCRPYAFCHSSRREFMWVLTLLAVFRRLCFLGVLNLHWSLHFFWLLFHRVPWALQVGGWWRHPIRTECSKFAHSLDLSSLCICFQLLQEEASSMMVEQDTHNTVSLGVISCSFNRTIVFSFTLGPGLPQLRFLAICTA